MTNRIAVGVVVCLLQLACGGNEPLVSNDDQNSAPKVVTNPFQLAFGETVTVTAENVEVTFADVVSDSRCPIDVVCFWEGEVTIGLRIVDLPADTHYVPMSMRPGFMGPIAATKDTVGFRISLIDILPYPISTVPVTDSDYVAKIAIFRLEPRDTTLTGEVVVGNDWPILGDLFQLDTVFIVGDILHLAIWHGGGCGDHDYELFFSPASFAESLPVQATLRPRHTDLDDPCDAWLRQELTFDLRPLAQFYQISYGTLDCMQVHVSDDLSGAQTSRVITVRYYPSGMRSTPWCSRQST